MEVAYAWRTRRYGPIVGVSFAASSKPLRCPDATSHARHAPPPTSDATTPLRHAHAGHHAYAGGALRRAPRAALLCVLAAAPAAAQPFVLLNDTDSDGTTNPLAGVEERFERLGRLRQRRRPRPRRHRPRRECNRTARIYENDGTGSFTDIGAGLTGVKTVRAIGATTTTTATSTSSSPAKTRVTETARIYENDGTGSFTALTGSAVSDLVGVSSSSSDWGDYDNDGDLDLVVTGFDGELYRTTRTARIYANDGTGSFTNIGAGLTGVEAVRASGATLTTTATSTSSSPASTWTLTGRRGSTRTTARGASRRHRREPRRRELKFERVGRLRQRRRPRPRRHRQRREW